MASPGLLKLRSTDAHSSRVQDNVSTAVSPSIQALSRTPIMGMAPNWTQPTLLADFVNVGGGLAIAAYYKDSLFRVQSKGSISSAAGQAAGTSVMQFPSGFRPSETLRLPIPTTPGGQWLLVSPTGLVTLGFVVAAGAGLDLSFSFLSEQ